MAGRPELEIGTYGKIRFRPLDDGRVQARARFRDLDGIARPVTRIGKTETDAERLLKRTLRDRQRTAGDETISATMRLHALADFWLDRVDASDKAIGTKQQYRKYVARYITPRMGKLKISECSVPACDRVLIAISDQHGPAVAKSCRAVLSGILGLATRHGALVANPVRDTEAIAGASKPKRGKPKALTVEEAEDVSDRLRTLARAMPPSEKNKGGLDLADLVDFMLGTGARIGEALACRDGLNDEGTPLLDLDAGTWEVNATIVRVTGDCLTCTHGRRRHPKLAGCIEKQCDCAEFVKPPGTGLIVQERTKSEAGWRVLALPSHLVDMLGRRRSETRLRAPHGIVFGSPQRRSLRDPNNAAGDLKEVMLTLGYPWITSHNFRKTVATRMDEAGCTAREIADQLGHSKPSMTLDKYMGRNVVSARAAEVLARR